MTVIRDVPVSNQVDIREKEVPVEKPIHHHHTQIQQVEKEVPVERRVPVPVEKPIHHHHTEVQQVEKLVPQPYPVEKRVRLARSLCVCTAVLL